MNGEVPASVGWVLMIHLGKPQGARNEFFGLGPLKNEFRGQNGCDRMKVVRRHEAPELANNFRGFSWRHNVLRAVANA